MEYLVQIPVLCVLLSWIGWVIFKLTTNYSRPPSKTGQIIAFILLSISAWMIGQGLDFLKDLVLGMLI